MFRSQVYRSHQEMISDLLLISRNAFYQNAMFTEDCSVEAGLSKRHVEDTIRILRLQREAEKRYEKHLLNGGTEYVLQPGEFAQR